VVLTGQAGLMVLVGQMEVAVLMEAAAQVA
jgi:hypothetical protein